MVKYIISNIFGGGTQKYVLDLMNNYKNVRRISSLEDITFYEEDLIMVQHLFNTNISISDLLTKKAKIYITIHDCYWLNENILYAITNDNSYLWQGKYMDKNIKINPDIIALFKCAKKIICPSEFIMNIYKLYFPDSNFIHIYHNDVDIINCKVRKIVKNCINIGIFHVYFIYKGKEFIEKLRNRYSTYKTYDINYKIIGENIDKYNEEDFFDKLNIHNIHGLCHLNKCRQTYCYTITKYINSGLPVIYNNIGSFKERILNNSNFFEVYNDEYNMNDDNLLYNKFELFLDHIINSPNVDNISIIPNKIIYNSYYDELLK